MKILKFFGLWCGPCKALTKAFEEAKIEHQDNNVDGNEELADKYHVKSVPTVIVLDNEGEELGRFVGLRTKKQLLEELNKYKSLVNE